jgi:hypothetical protein
MTQHEQAAKSRGGRPPRVTISSEDAKIVREAMKLAARYYGIRLQDLGPGGSWITRAMRTKAPMSVETGLALHTFITHPKPGLVGKKRPQGTPTGKIMQRYITLRQETGEELSSEAFGEVEDDVGARFMGFANMAALMLQKYRLPFPGTAVFVMPGTSRVVAQKLIALFPDGSIKKQYTRDIEEMLVRYFESGEKPLQSELGKKLIPRLTILSLAENLRDVASYLKEEGWPDEELGNLETWALDVGRSESRRQRARRRGPSKESI